MRCPFLTNASVALAQKQGRAKSLKLARHSTPSVSGCSSVSMRHVSLRRRRLPRIPARLRLLVSSCFRSWTGKAVFRSARRSSHRGGAQICFTVSIPLLVYFLARVIPTHEDRHDSSNASCRSVPEGYFLYLPRTCETALSKSRNTYREQTLPRLFNFSFLSPGCLSKT